MRRLIRTYTVWEFIYRIWDRQTVLIKTKKKRKKTGAFKRCILLSLSVKRPLIFWTRRLHLDVLQSQCIHTCHTNRLIIRLPLLMIRVNRLFTAQRSVNLFVLRFYGPVNPMGSCRARPVYLTTRLLSRLSPLSG